MSFDIHNIKILTDSDKALVTAAQGVMKNAYNPYSGFHVGAAVLTESGKIYSGTFMENASYGMTICAEPAALMAANTAGDFSVLAIAIAGGHPCQQNDNVITPCGRCRQIIYEAAQLYDRDIYVLCCNWNLSKVMKTSILELLPVPFNTKDANQALKVKSKQATASLP